jgi:tetratricopeptide (TPR) repeat protein
MRASLQRGRAGLVLLGSVLLFCATGPSRSAEPEEARFDAALPEVEIRDLHYGDVLFHFFQDDYLEAIVRLEAAADLGRLPNHASEAELLSGGLYLSLGLHEEARRIFDRLLTGNVPAGVSNRARYYLALIGYQRGYYDEAWSSLQRIEGPLPEPLEGERRLLAANVLMAQQRFPAAAELLQDWQGATGLAAYARFNLGVAMLRSGATDPGRRLLEEVGRIPARSEEERALRDRANLALGFASLHTKDAAQAAAALSRVRLDGPFTNRALLGLGWAEAELDRPDRALVPWLALRERALIDSAVQESYLAVPYAYARLAANGQAVEQYRRAVDAYAAESRRLRESIAAIRAGGFLDAVLDGATENWGAGWFWQLRELPDAPHTRYLYHLLASHEFQEGLKNYRDLRTMQSSLVRVRDSLEAFDAMIEARAISEESRLRRKVEFLGGTDLAILAERQRALEERVQRIANGREVIALADAAESRQLASIEELSQRLGSLPAGEQRDALLERLRVLRGVLLWDLDAEYKLRLSRLERSLGGSAAALVEAGQRIDQVGKASFTAGGDTAAFVSRVASLAGRLEGLEPQLGAAAAAQERVLAEIAVAELEAQQRRLGSYATQAQFALATLYDGAVAGSAY